MMTVIEEQYLNVVPDMLKEIERQLKIANKLKEIELKEKYPYYDTIINDIMYGE